MTGNPEPRRAARGPATLAGAAFALALAAGAANADPILESAAVADGVTIPTQAECQSAWDGSSASDTCGAGVSSVYYGSLPAATVRIWYNFTYSGDSPDFDNPSSFTITVAGCRVRTLCMPAGLGADRTVRENRGVDTWWAGSIDDMPDLENIDGRLAIR